MRLRCRDRIICGIITIALLISGVCVDNVKADTLVSADQISYVQTQSTAEALSAQNTYVSPSEGCTHEMLGRRSNAASITEAKKNVARTMAHGSSTLTTDVENQPHHLCTILEMIVREPNSEFPSNTIIIHFIHSQDGKKNS